MARILTVGAAQLGPIQRADDRTRVVKRLIDLLRQAHSHGCQLVVFPELALTTFFPRWWMTDQEEIDSFFEREMPSNETAPLFNEAQRLGLGFYLGFAELDASGPAVRRFNTSILVGALRTELNQQRRGRLLQNAIRVLTVRATLRLAQAASAAYDEPFSRPLRRLLRKLAREAVTTGTLVQPEAQRLFRHIVARKFERRAVRSTPCHASAL